MQTIEMYNEDCLQGMSRIGDGTVDLVLCDLPYGTTRCPWDTVIPFEPLWEQYNRVVKHNGALIFTATQPFATDLINSNRKMFRYDLVLEKPMPVGFANSNRMPMRSHELILVFYRRLPTYNPQGLIKLERQVIRRERTDGGVYDRLAKQTVKQYTNYPRSVLRFPFRGKRIHSTQKPLELMEYLVRTYSNEGDLVLDNCMGSGTTAVACINTGRRFVGFEMDKEIFEMARRRINA